MDNSLTVQLACHAMATRFEFVLCGHDQAALRAAGEEAIREIERIENKFSLYKPTSIISNLNAKAGNAEVRTDLETFAFLKQAAVLSQQTGGAFDPTIAPLMFAWGLIRQAEETKPDQAEIREAKKLTGMNRVKLDEASRTVCYEKAGMKFDPGGIGKGYALDCAADLLKELGVENALIHAGTSTVLAWGRPADVPEWKIAVELPDMQNVNEPQPAKIFSVNNQALSVSAVWGKMKEADGRKLGHVIDPRTGKPVESALLAACIASNATQADAYSTAMLVLNSEAPDFARKTKAIFDYFLLLADGTSVSSEKINDILVGNP